MGQVTIPLSNLGGQFFSREHTSPPCPTVGGNLGTEGAPAPLALSPSSPSQKHLPTVQAETRRRKQEDEQPSPALLKPMRRVCNKSKTGSELRHVKSWVVFTNFSVKVGPNFSNPMSRLNSPSPDRAAGSLWLQEEAEQNTSRDNTV